MTNSVHKIFDSYNQKYFKGRLTHKLVLRAIAGCNGYTCEGKQEIFLDPALSRPKIREVLVHEMAHASGRTGHTQAWLKEMQRLRRLGAPVNLNGASELVFAEECCLEMEHEKPGSSFLLPPWCCGYCKEEHIRRIRG